MTSRRCARRVPFLRLSAFYLFFFGSLGAFLPYWALYLDALGFGTVEIGELMAVVMVAKVIAPNVWGWIADHGGRRMSLIRMAAAGAALAFALLGLVDSYLWLMLLLAAYGFFWNAALPLFEATTLNYLQGQEQRYSRLRLWGSIGFILAVMGLAPVLERVGIHWLPWIVTGILAALWLSTLTLSDARYGRDRAAATQSLRAVLLRPGVLALLLTFFLAQFSHGPYYTFFSIYLEHHGYSKDWIGMLWALAVVAEVGVFLRVHEWLDRVGPGPLLLVALGLTGLRWLMIGHHPPHLGVLLVAQCLHAASFGLMHSTAIHLVHRLFPGRLQSRGQALYFSLSFGLGGAVGSLGSGYAWNALGATEVFYIAALSAFTGLATAWWGLIQLRRRDLTGIGLR